MGPGGRKTTDALPVIGRRETAHTSTARNKSSVTVAGHVATTSVVSQLPPSGGPKRSQVRRPSSPSRDEAGIPTLSCAVCVRDLCFPVRVGPHCDHVVCRSCLARYTWTRHFADADELREMRLRAARARRASQANTAADPTGGAPDAGNAPDSSCGGFASRGAMPAAGAIDAIEAAIRAGTYRLPAVNCPLCRAPTTLEDGLNARSQDVLQPDEKRMLGQLPLSDPRRVAIEVLLLAVPDAATELNLHIFRATRLLSEASAQRLSAENQLLSCIASGHRPEQLAVRLDAAFAGDSRSEAVHDLSMVCRGGFAHRNAPSVGFKPSSAAQPDDEDDEDNVVRLCRPRRSRMQSITEIIADKRMASAAAAQGLATLSGHTIPPLCHTATAQRVSSARRSQWRRR
jgi:hypothetical protein